LLEQKYVDDIRRLRYFDDKYRQNGFMPKAQNIGRGELEILQFVQEHHPVTVREVADHFAETKGHVRTTILNVMERLRKKGYLTRHKNEGMYRYAPRQKKTEFVQRMVRDFVDKALEGSVSPFVAYLANKPKISDEELNELKQLVRNLDQQRTKEKP
jgi:predicted transcriptional regulator